MAELWCVSVIYCASQSQKKSPSEILARSPAVYRSGQSNMQWSMDASEHVAEEAPAANHRAMRLFQIDTAVAAQTLDDVPHTWMPCTTETVKSFSAVAYHFGEKLHRELGVPVGLINTSWGAFATPPR